MMRFPRFQVGRIILLLVSSVPFFHVARAWQCFDNATFKSAATTISAGPWSDADAGIYGPIDEWCTKDVTNMNFAFAIFNNGNQATLVNADISKWDTSSVTSMSYMFYQSKINQDLKDWNTSKVKDMQSMFYSAKEFNGDVSQWDTSSVENMSQMFLSAAAFNRDVSQWDLSSATNMASMFFKAAKFNQFLCPWKYEFPFGEADNIFSGSDCTYENTPFSGSSSFCAGSAPVCMTYKPPEPTSTPTAKPTSSPSPMPSHQPTPRPTAAPTSKPTSPPSPMPSHQPTASPSSEPTSPPSPQPTASPSSEPTSPPSPKPTASPSSEPTSPPSPKPTASPSSEPTSPPSPKPTASPSSEPTSPPSSNLASDDAPGPTPLHLSEDSPTPGPTRSIKSWALDILSFSSNFDLDSTNEITLNYEIGAGRDFKIGLFSKGCIEEVTDNVVTHTNSTSSAEDTSLQNLQVFLDVKKDSILGSNIWNGSKKNVELCVRVELLSGDFVMKKLERNFGINLLFGTEFETIDDAKFGQISLESNQTDAQVENYIEACTCDNKESFTCNQNVLGPNDFLNVCIKSAAEEMEIDYLDSLKMVQGTLTLNIVQEKKLVDGTISSKSQVQLNNGVHVASVIPASFFSYEDDTTGEVSGVVYLKLKESRRRLAVEISGHPRAEVIDSTTAVTRALQTGSVGDQEAAFAIQVKLEKDVFLALEAFANGAMDDVMPGFNIFAFGFAAAIMMWW